MIYKLVKPIVGITPYEYNSSNKYRTQMLARVLHQLPSPISRLFSSLPPSSSLSRSPACLPLTLQFIYDCGLGLRPAWSPSCGGPFAAVWCPQLVFHPGVYRSDNLGVGGMANKNRGLVERLAFFFTSFCRWVFSLLGLPQFGFSTSDSGLPRSGG